MNRRALFEGLVVDEDEKPVAVGKIGDEPCYIIDDQGFKRHISSVDIDRQVLKIMGDLIRGHEDLISEQTAKMIGQEDIFSMAMIESQLKNIDVHMDNLLETGIPEAGRAYMGMLGFQVKINVHGEVLSVKQPGMDIPDE